MTKQPLLPWMDELGQLDIDPEINLNPLRSDCSNVNLNNLEQCGKFVGV